MTKKVKMHGSFIIAGVLVLAGTAAAQDSEGYAKIETSPGFSYVHNSEVFGGSKSFNCAGGGGTVAYNMTSMFGFAMDLSGCKVFGLNDSYGPGSKLNGSEFTYVFGPRITFRNFGKIQPFGELNFGGERVSISCKNGNAGNACGSVTAVQPLPTDVTTSTGAVIVIPSNPNATSFSKNAFAMTVGGGFDIKLNKKFAIRLVQAEYLYTRFGNDCPLAYCSQNNSQNSFRLKSGVVIGWGAGAK
jgi:opacity protein-like surface antigen